MIHKFLVQIESAPEKTRWLQSDEVIARELASQARLIAMAATQGAIPRVSVVREEIFAIETEGGR